MSWPLKKRLFFFFHLWRQLCVEVAHVNQRLGKLQRMLWENWTCLRCYACAGDRWWLNLWAAGIVYVEKYVIDWQISALIPQFVNQNGAVHRRFHPVHKHTKIFQYIVHIIYLSLISNLVTYMYILFLLKSMCHILKKKFILFKMIFSKYVFTRFIC
jgi:hypothetical protein